MQRSTQTKDEYHEKLQQSFSICATAFREMLNQRLYHFAAVYSQPQMKLDANTFFSVRK